MCAHTLNLLVTDSMKATKVFPSICTKGRTQMSHFKHSDSASKNLTMGFQSL